MSTAELPPAPLRESYQDIPYPGGSFRASHPSHIAMIARVMGIETASPSNCRVLELGCSQGANLLPMAEGHPNSEYVGIDFESNQISVAQSLAEEAGLTNIRFEHKSILDIDKDFGEFDYIIAHGVYSWVPHDVQNKILEIGKNNLSPNGVLYVSYNTNPGWHFRGLIRDMMLYHTEGLRTPQEKIAQARGLLKFLKDHSKTRFEAYTTLLKEEAEMVEKADDYYLFHDHLEEVNEPLYFSEFVERVDAAGLRYLADTALATMVAQLFDNEAAEMLRNAPMLRREQYMDFLRNRMFRSSLLTHQNVTPNYDVRAAKLDDLHVALSRPLNRTGEDPLGVHWANPDSKFTTEGTVTKVIERLNEACPAWVSMSDLLDLAIDAADRKGVADAMLMAQMHGQVNLACEPVTVASRPGEKPLVSPLSRLRAKRGEKVANRLHGDCVLQPQQKFIVQQFDGTRTVEEVAQLLHEEIASGRFKVSKDDQDLSPSLEQLTEIVSDEINRMRMIGIFAG